VLNEGVVETVSHSLLDMCYSLEWLSLCS